MKNIARNILAGAVSVLALASCELDQFPKNAIVYDENEPVIQKASDLASFENGILTRFRAANSGVSLFVDDIMGDGFNATLDFGNQYGPVHRTNADYTASDQDIEDIWGDYYITIKDYNIAIAAANNIVDRDLKKKAETMKGEAFVFRAFTYLQLVRHFAKAYSPATASTDLGVPVVTVYDQNDKPARSTVAGTYAQIKDDLDSAAFYLAGVKGAARAQKPTIDFVKAVYARYYLDVQDYANAATMADDVIATGAYELSSTAAQMSAEFTMDNGKEPIVQLAASLSEKPGQMHIWTRLGSSNGETVFQPYYLPSETLVSAYDEDDIRLAAWFSFGKYPIYMRGALYSDDDVAVFTKFIGNLAYTSSSVPDARNAVKPIRISEMYLISAEAKANNNDEQGALATLNVLREKRGANTTGAGSVMDAIRAEWFKETAGEGLRTVCLKRWGIGYEGRPAQSGAGKLVMTSDSYVSKVMAAGDYRMTWPIPTYERQVNRNLVQNEGYTVSAN